MLNLRENSLRELPARFSTLNNLLIVDLSHNQFRDFPLSLCETVSLQYIDISDCHISSIPSDIGKLRNVQVFRDRVYKDIVLRSNSALSAKNYDQCSTLLHIGR